MRLLLIIISFVFSSFIFSAVSDWTVEGIVVSYNKKKVVLAQDNGQKITVNRTSISKDFKLKTGARVIAVIPGEKLVKLVKKSEDNKKKRAQRKAGKTKR